MRTEPSRASSAHSSSSIQGDVLRSPRATSTTSSADEESDEEARWMTGGFSLVAQPTRATAAAAAARGSGSAPHRLARAAVPPTFHSLRGSPQRNPAGQRVRQSSWPGAPQDDVHARPRQGRGSADGLDRPPAPDGYGGPMSSGGGVGGNDELWVSIERYLMAAYTALQEGEESQLRPLNTPKHRMGWYAVVYNACNGNPANSRELYARLALAVFHALEVFVLYPILQHADRGRLQIITGQEAAAARGSGPGGGGDHSGSRKGSLKLSSLTNSSFRFVRRLLFRESEGGAGRQPSTPTHTHTAHPPSSSRSSSSTGGVGPGVEGLSPTSSPVGGRAQPGRSCRLAAHPQPPLAARFSETWSSNHSPPLTPHGQGSSQGGNARPAPAGGAREQRLASITSAVSSPPSEVRREGRPGSAPPESLHRPLTLAAVSQETGRVLVGEEELPLPDASEAGSPSGHGGAHGKDRVMDAGGGAAGGEAQPSPSRQGTCRAFVGAYATFAIFRRIVLSCFRYLDQYYTRRYGMDTLSVMCAKLFYVVVYEPVKPLLMDELFTKLTAVREAQGRGYTPRPHLATAADLATPLSTMAGAESHTGSSAPAPPGVARAGLTDAEAAECDASVRLVQDTLAVITGLLAAVQTTASYLVAGDVTVAGGGGGSSGGGGDRGGGGAAREFSVARASRAASVSPGPATHDALLDEAAEARRRRSGASSGTASSTTTPRLAAGDVAGQTPVTTTATTPPASRPSRRRRLMNLFKLPGSAGAVTETGGRPSSAPVSPQRPVAEDGSVERGGGPCDCSRAQSPASTQEHGQGELAGATAAVSPAAGTLVVDLRGALEVRQRLESRSLTLSLAHQALRHTELYGGGGGGGNNNNNNNSAGAPQTGTIIKEIGQSLASLVGDNFGDQYLNEVAVFYRREREGYMATVEGRRGYLRWVNRAITLERLLVMRVGGVHSLHTALHATLAQVLIVEVHQALILDPAAGLQRLLEAWSGDTTDDVLVAAMLDRECGAGSAAGLGSEGGRPGLSGTSPSERTASTAAHAPGRRGGGGEGPRIVVRARTMSSSLAGVGAAAAASVPAPVPALPLEDRARAVGFYLNTFLLASDDACERLLATVLATKAIRDCASMAGMYLQRVWGGGKGSAELAEDPHGGHVSRSTRRRLTDTVEAAGHTLMDGLVTLSMRYTQLIQDHAQSNPVLLGALRDAMAQVMNPTRWSYTSTSTSPSTTMGAGTGAARSAADGAGLFHRQGPGQAGRPSVLLGHDASGKAMAPLAALVARDPRVVGLRVSALMAAYADRLCTARRGSSGFVDAAPDLGGRLRHVVDLVLLMDHKDEFLELYREHLARRLLTATADDTAVRVLVQQLQRKLGVGSVHAYEAMLRDCANTTVARAAFESSAAFQQLPVPMRVHLLSSARWPTYGALNLRPHPSLAAGMTAFEAHYSRIHPARLLRWVHVLGTARLVGEFPLGEKEIVASTVQATILLLVSEAANREWGSTAGESAAVLAGPPRVHGLLSGSDSECGPADSPRDLRSCASSATSPTAAVLTPRTPAEPDKACEDTCGPGAATATTTPHYHAVPRLGSLFANLTVSTLLPYRLPELGLEGASGGEHAPSTLPAPSMMRPPRGTVTGAALAAAMGVDFSELRPHLSSLVARRGVPLLVCVTDTTAARALLPTDRLTLNDRFSHGLRRITLPAASGQRRPTPGLPCDTAEVRGDGLGGGGGDSAAQRWPTQVPDRHRTTTPRQGSPAHPSSAEAGGAGEGEGHDTDVCVQSLRKLQLDAVIVRVLKSEGEATYHQLLTLVTQHVARLFRPTPKDIKARLESLLEREFIARSPHDGGVFTYNA